MIRFLKLTFLLLLIFNITHAFHSRQNTIVNVRDAGAKGDGKSDDAPAINKAIDILVMKGGGTLYFPRGTYNLASTFGVNNSLIVPKSNIDFKGDGIDISILFVSKGLNDKYKNGFNVIFPATSDPKEVIYNLSVEKLTIDLNGQNNISSGIKSCKNAAIGVRFGSNITVNEVKIVNNPGRQCVSFGNNNPNAILKNVVVKNCIFSNMADAITGNNTQNDHSAIYIFADKYVISNNTITNEKFSQATTAIEVHGFNGTIDGNKINNVHKAFNCISSLISSRNIIFVNNICTNIQMAFATIIGKGLSLTEIIVSKNTFSFLRSDRNSYFDLTTNVDKSVTGNTISITNNKITEVKSNDIQSTKTKYIFFLSNSKHVVINNNVISTGDRMLMSVFNNNMGSSIDVQNNDISISSKASSSPSLRSGLGNNQNLIQIQSNNNGDSLIINNNTLRSPQKFNFLGKGSSFRQMNVNNNKFSGN